MTLGCLFSMLLHAAPAPASEVFQVDVRVIDPNTMSLDWQIKPGYFLYKDRIRLSEPKNSNANINIPQYPQADKKTDRQGKTFAIYRQQLSLPVAVLGHEPGESLLNLSYQGCSDDGFCYPPENRQIKITINQQKELNAATVEQLGMEPKTTSQAPALSQEEAIFDGHLIMIILSFFGFGLLLAFTPCVLPMVPVLSGIIVGHGEDLTTRKAFFLSLSYVLSMAVTYAMVGAVVALLGSNLQIIMQSPWSITIFSLIFVLLSLSMFGYYELKLPTSWQAKLANLSRSQSSGHYLSAAIMGGLSTLILSPCVTAPLIGALSYIAHSGNAFLGSMALFFLGLGMGTPLLLIGTSAGKLLPKAGPWMNTIKSFFGILLLAVSIYLMARILPSFVTMMLWASLFIFSGIFSGAINPLTHQNRFHQSIGIILLVYGLLILIGASMGNDDPIMPLKPLISKTTAASVEIVAEKEPILSIKALKKALKQARGKPVMLDFYADWCNSCKIIESTTLKDPAVQSAMKNFVLLKADITANNKNDKALLKRYQVVAPPTFLFFDKDGKEIKQMRLVGDVETKRFLQHIKDYCQLNDNC